nr:unnamed protein product [Callosobruchus analis]
MYLQDEYSQDWLTLNTHTGLASIDKYRYHYHEGTTLSPRKPLRGHDTSVLAALVVPVLVVGCRVSLSEWMFLLVLDTNTFVHPLTVHLNISDNKIIKYLTGPGDTVLGDGASDIGELEVDDRSLCVADMEEPLNWPKWLKLPRENGRLPSGGSRSGGCGILSPFIINWSRFGGGKGWHFNASSAYSLVKKSPCSPGFARLAKGDFSKNKLAAVLSEVDSNFL